MTVPKLFIRLQTSQWHWSSYREVYWWKLEACCSSMWWKKTLDVSTVLLFDSVIHECGHYWRHRKIWIKQRLCTYPTIVISLVLNRFKAVFNKRWWWWWWWLIVILLKFWKRKENHLYKDGWMDGWCGHGQLWKRNIIKDEFKVRIDMLSMICRNSC